MIQDFNKFKQTRKSGQLSRVGVGGDTGGADIGATMSGPCGGEIGVTMDGLFGGSVWWRNKGHYG
jgi:hypothetical protein